LTLLPFLCLNFQVLFCLRFLYGLPRYLLLCDKLLTARGFACPADREDYVADVAKGKESYATKREVTEDSKLLHGHWSYALLHESADQEEQYLVKDLNSLTAALCEH